MSYHSHTYHPSPRNLISVLTAFYQVSFPSLLFSSLFSIKKKRRISLIFLKCKLHHVILQNFLMISHFIQNKNQGPLRTCEPLHYLAPYCVPLALFFLLVSPSLVVLASLLTRNTPGFPPSQSFCLYWNDFLSENHMAYSLVFTFLLNFHCFSKRFPGQLR